MMKTMMTKADQQALAERERAAAMMTKAELQARAEWDRATAMLSPEQVAALVGLTAAGVRRGALRERLPWVKVGHRTLRCPREAVEQLVRGL